MAQEQDSPVTWMVPNVKDVAAASAQQVKEANKASMDAWRAIMEIYQESAELLRGRGDGAFRSGMDVVQAAMDANFDQFNQLAETKNLQDVIRLEMLWGANLTLAICRALNKANGFGAKLNGASARTGGLEAVGGAKRAEAANA